eukprot:gene2995-3740_t
MESKKLIETFAEFARSKNVDRPTVIRILEEVFNAMIHKKFGTNDNFDIIVNLDQGDLQIWRFREVVDDDSEDIWEHDKISLSEAKKIEPDFDIGEEVSEEIRIDSFGRRAITAARQTLIQKVKDLEKDALYLKYTQLIGEMITVEIHQVLPQEIIVVDEERKELFIPKSEQIFKDNFKKGDYIKAVVHQIDLRKSTPKVILSRTSPLFLERLLESEVPEISDGIITIKKVVREPGERAKVAVESLDERIDPVGACVGIKGSRIHNIVRELQNENIDVINYTENLDLYIGRALSPARISSIQMKGDRVAVYLKPDQVSLAIGKSGQNIKLASRLVGKEIDVYREVENVGEDVNLEEFTDEIEPWVIEELQKIGLDSAKSVLALSKEELEDRTDLEAETINELYIARKLNVATTTIATYLAEKGFQVENKPNTKITPEQYTLLAEEFAGSAMDKEEAAELTIGQSYISEQEAKILAKQQEASQNATMKEAALEIEPPPIPAAIETPTPLEETTDLPSESNVPTIEEISTHLDEPSVSIQEETMEESTLYTTEEPIEPPAIDQQPIAPTTNKIDFNKPELFQGVKVLGKIELAEKSEPKKFQQVTSSDVTKKHTKRLRTRIGADHEGTSTTKPAGTYAQPSYKERHQKNTAVSQKPAVSEKEIQEQIKTTLAKLGGNKNVTSRAKYKREKRSLLAEELAEQQLQAATTARKLQITEFIAANDLATLMGVSINELLSTCMNLGMLVSINQRLDAEAITVIADEFGFQVTFTDVKAEETEEEEVTDPNDLVERAPIVTIMGHVDHGKTSLLDYIRNTQITKTEAGGITQHIGAYEVVTEHGKHIAFLDTPGHEAFTAMRSRGAKITDIAIIVVAADDGVRPQTKEAINHAKLAGVPIVIAINKIDKPQANPEKVKEELAHLNILVEDWGGKYQCQGVSAITGEGVNALLDKILFESELLELKANPNKKAKGTIIEASLDQGRGYLTTTMIQEGTLRIGDVILAGAYYGKIRAMFNYQGKQLKQAGPSTPVQLLGLNGAPQAGDLLRVMNNDKEARDVAAHRRQILREQGFRTKTHITLDEIGRRLAIGNFKELNIILKGDVDGSVEALLDSLLKLSTEEIKVNILHKGVGAIVDSDVLLAAASDAIIIGFQVRPTPSARKLAEKEGIEIRLYSIIYDAINHIRDAMEGMLAPTIEEVITGTANVREIFKITGIGIVAGCYVAEGHIKKNNPIRVIRDGIVVATGAIKHLKHFKEDVPQMKAGFECGISLANFNDLKVGDSIEGFEQKEIERKL